MTCASADRFIIRKIELHTDAEVPNIDEKTFQEQAETAKKNCPVSQALAGVEIQLQARLIDQPSR
jgi:osmotically inducible protein OsmC